jgi:hypothetical protein
MEPRNRFKGTISASLCRLAGRYDNPISSQFLALIECLKIPALHGTLAPVGPKVPVSEGGNYLEGFGKGFEDSVLAKRGKGVPCTHV